MKLPKDLLQGIDRYLGAAAPKTLKRGRGYFARGDVLGLECAQPDRQYDATVRGGQDYRVSLRFAETAWSSQCSCPMGSDCKHAVAAMLELQKRATSKGEMAKPAQLSFKQSHVPQPPHSPLYDRVITQLGRLLAEEEASFVYKVQAIYSKTKFRAVSENDLAQISGDYFGSWKTVELWRKPPGEDFHFWLYVAWELRRRGIGHPEFIDGVTDLTLIEAEMSEWEREKEIQRWGSWFGEFEEQAAAPDPGMLDLRLVVAAHEARLQWRAGTNSEFAQLKQAQAKRIAEQFSNGSLNIAPESLPLWTAVFRPWGYNNWWSFKYDDSTARPALNRLLRMPLSADRIVTPDGAPIERVAEPLKLQLRPPQNGDPNYQISLTTASGSPPPPILCSLGGQPTLYLAERHIFTGPPAELLDTEPSKLIPTEALESEAGLRFLHATGLPMPEHLAQRVRTAPVSITLSCELEPAYSGPSDDVHICVTAKAPGLMPEQFTSSGWESKGARKHKAVNGIIILHDRTPQRHFPRLLETLGAKPNGRGDWTFRLTKKAVEPFAAWLQSIPPEFEVQLGGELATLRDAPLSGNVSLDVQEAGMDWFDLKVILKVSDTTLTAEELKLLLNARGGYVRLGKKGWRRLHFQLSAEEDEHLARLGLNPADFTAEPQRLHALQLADESAEKFLAPERVEKIQRRIGELKTRVTPVLPGVIRAEMRPYQTEGFHFLAYLVSNSFGGVLADDMGLGKTLQTLAWLAWLRETASCSPNAALVVCPKSVMDNWRAESERFYPGLRVCLWRGQPAEELSAARQKADLIVINYAQLRVLSPEIGKLSWLAAILDEAQCIKNPDSQTAQSARALKADHRLALTGTPIENRLLDLWSIFAFAMPGALGNRAHFLRSFNAEDDPLARRRLASRVRPFLLRRTKGQVATDLPDRVEKDLLCEMEGEQRTLYMAELKRARQLILGLQSAQQLNQERFNILTSLLRLRQICCHPALVNKDLRKAGSAKVEALEDLLEPLVSEGHKVLVFSQFASMLELLRENLTERQWPHYYLAGETENRGELVRQFQAAEDSAIFLISLKAGGFGLNLTAASYVVLFDPWWNPAVENQAIDRTHRIGQTSKVMAYRLLIRDSIEQKIRALQGQKAALADNVLGEERFSQSLTLDDLRFLFAE